MRRKRDYVRGLWVSIAAIMLLLPTSTRALERAGLFGASMTFPLQLKPTVKRGDPAFGIDMGYFFTERWAGVLSFDFGLRGENRVDLAVGPQFYILNDVTIAPYVVGKFIYVLDKKKDFGWRASVGGEWNLVKWTGMDNTRVFAESGVSQIFLDHQSNPLLFELLRIGLSWNF